MSSVVYKFTITKDNKHLIDVFSDDYYLELGNISNESMDKLFKYKLVRYSDLTYFDIQNKGIGTSNITDLELKEKIPYFYFENMINKKKSNQLFITYGVFVQRKGYKELFTPIILIPVNMFVYSGEIYFQLNSSPIENPFLPSYRKTNDNNKDRFKSVYDLDTFCMEIYKIDKHNLRLENYLTFANTSIPDKLFFTDKFSLDGPVLNNIKNGFNVSKENPVYNISSLNRTQRMALEEAHFGNSFAITGVLGTGKTTTLCNIASDAVYNNKNILYITNQKSTLNEVIEFYKEKELDYLIADMTDPFINYHERYHDSKKIDLIDSIVKNEIITKYDGIEDYTRMLYEKINDYYFIDVMKYLIEYKDIKNDINKDTLKGIENIYRLESQKVKVALNKIDSNLNKINSFKDSKFNNIPINNLSSNKEILKLLTDLCQSYSQLMNKKIVLENDYGFSNIPNYAYFRNIINNYHQINKMAIPTSWLIYASNDYDKKTLVNFEKAREAFINFTSEINDANAKERLLASEYNTEGLDNFDIHYSINLILSRFENKNNEEINVFLKNNKKLCENFNGIKDEIDNCEYNFGKMRDKIGLKIDIRNKKIMDEIVPFILFFGSSVVPKSWLDIKNSDGIRKKIETIIISLDEYTSLINLYNQLFIDVNNIDNNIAFLKKKSEKNDKYRGYIISDLISQFEKLDSIVPNINSLFSQYYVLTSENYVQKNNILERFDKFTGLLKNISDEKIQNKMIKSLNSLKSSSLEEYIKPFILFSTSYLNINKMYDELCFYNLTTPVSDLPTQINNINETKEYCLKINSIQEKMSKIIKRDLAYIPYQEYIILASKIENLVIIRTKIDKNKEYKRLYGMMFEGYNSNINSISKQIVNFSQYINIFKDNNNLCSSLSVDNNKEIEAILNQSFVLCEKINDLLKDYSKIFRDGVGKFYYDPIISLINLLNNLISSSDELKIYLEITSGMKVLLKYKLFDLNEYIINHDHETFENRFMSCYYHMLCEKFENKFPMINNSEGYYKLLNDIIKWENEICVSNVERIKHRLPCHYFSYNLKGNNYNKYVERIKDYKHIFLANSQIMNQYLDISKFDLVLVDDASLLECDQYEKCLQANQVIFAGINNIRVSIMNDVFSKIRKNAIIDFKYRYSVTPLSLLSSMTRASGNFYSDDKYNNGISVNKDKIDDIIISLIFNKNNEWNRDIKINCFIKRLDKIKNLYDELSIKLVNKNLNVDDIYYVLNNQVNICDLGYGYLFNSDYNILELDDYYNESDIYENNNLISNLICTKVELIIVDQENLMGASVKSNFIKSIHALYKSNGIIIPVVDDVCTRLVQTLTHHRIKVLGKYKYYDIVFQRKKKNYGIIIFNSPTNYDNSILNVYRNFKCIDFPCSIVLIHDLVTDYYGTIKKIIGEFKDE